jgi:hypothetical protein
VIRRSKVMVEWPIGYDEYKSSQVVGSTWRLLILWWFS